MSMTQSQVFHKISELRLDELSFCQTSVNGLQAWTSELNIHHLGDAARALFKAILEISELKCQETLRFDLIQTIHPIVENILNSLEKHFFNQALISDDRNEQIIELALLLRLNFAKSYIDIACRSNEQLTSQSFSLFAFKLKKNVQTARTVSTYYALQQLAHLFYQQQILYSVPLPGQWLITHQLMHVALKNNFNTANINQILGTKHQISTINQAYSRIILLEIFNTHQIRPAEIQGLFLCSLEWAKYLQINSKESSISRYLIDVSQDLAPIYNNHRGQSDQANIFIATQQLLEYLTENQTKKSDKLSKNEKLFLTPALYFHIHTILTTNAERRHERYEYSARIKICFGLSVAHFYLSKAKNFTETLNLGNNYQVQNESALTSSINNNEPLTLNKKLDRETRKVHQVDVLDISVSGYRIKWTTETPKNLNTGEFILVQENDRSPWRGGVIRWIKQSADKGLELGLEILAQDIAPCAVYLQTERHAGHYHPALIMQTTELDEVSTSLILPGLSYLKDKQAVTLRLGTEELKVFLQKPLLITQSFMRFDFELLNELQQPILDNFIKKQLNEVKHHDLWETLK